jgi:ribulose-5-phosphate 4-epimerase/fuculose-1-phosphate aldolase
MKKIIIALVCVMNMTIFAMSYDYEKIKGITPLREIHEHQAKILEHQAKTLERQADALELLAVSQAMTACIEFNISNCGHIYLGPSLIDCKPITERYLRLTKQQYKTNANQK